MNSVTQDSIELGLINPLAGTLLTLPPSALKLSYQNTFVIKTINYASRYLELEVDKLKLEKFLISKNEIKVFDGSTFSKTFTILSLQNGIPGITTKIFVQEAIPNLGTLSNYLASYEKSFDLKSRNKPGNIIHFFGKKKEIALDNFIDFIKSKFFNHEGMHLIEHHLLRPRYCEEVNGEFIFDALLDIHLDQDCENCQITDPYSCVATVILPYWAGRFLNMDVRNFIEKTLRTEAPAHAFLNICWVNCEHMHGFETAYRNWLLEKSKKNPNINKENQTLENLINALNNARTVYPKGTLHSCDDDDTFNGSVILNNSALGTF